jgi:hypothetical protein
MTGDDVRTQTYDDGTRVVTTWHDDGRPPEVTVTPGPGTREANRQDITALARAALDLNATFLALAPPTTAQVVAQVKLLTREVNALIRLRVGDDALDTTQGTLNRKAN